MPLSSVYVSASSFNVTSGEDEHPASSRTAPAIAGSILDMNEFLSIMVNQRFEISISTESLPRVPDEALTMIVPLAAVALMIAVAWPLKAECLSLL